MEPATTFRCCPTGVLHYTMNTLPFHLFCLVFPLLAICHSECVLCCHNSVVLNWNLSRLYFAQWEHLCWRRTVHGSDAWLAMLHHPFPPITWNPPGLAWCPAVAQPWLAPRVDTKATDFLHMTLVWCCKLLFAVWSIFPIKACLNCCRNWKGEKMMSRVKKYKCPCPGSPV